MELNAWIDELDGVEAAAALLKEKPRTVASWYRFEKAPRLPSALNIVLRSKGRVDYNGIYGPIARARVETPSHHLAPGAPRLEDAK